MLIPQDIFDLNNNINDEKYFSYLVNKIEKYGVSFDIDDFEDIIRTIGYEETINIINSITYKLTEQSNKELLEKITWLKRLILKKNKEAIIVQLMSYDYDHLLSMCKEKSPELLTISTSTNNKYYTEEEFNEAFSYFWIEFKNTCLNYSYERIK